MFYCKKCKGTSPTSYLCENPECPNMPCCGKPEEECMCLESNEAVDAMLAEHKAHRDYRNAVIDSFRYSVFAALTLVVLSILLWKYFQTLWHLVPIIPAILYLLYSAWKDNKILK